MKTAVPEVCGGSPGRSHRVCLSDLLALAYFPCARKFAGIVNLKLESGATDPSEIRGDYGRYRRYYASIALAWATMTMLDEFREIFASPEVDDDGNMTGETIVKPVVVNKCSTGAENPFGATFCYGHKQLIVECLDDSHVATVILFPEASEPGSETSSVNSVSVE
uniref:SERPIN domain-containing protein n=1 Tax=Panagrellus redivivus TaxID=6233 RepID=A0A7E4UQA1_PANRE